MIHSTAIIEKGAELDRGVKVGAYSYIGPFVRLGEGCELRNGATIVGRTTVGEGCVFFTNSVIGEVPQDLKYRGEKTETIIGCDNHFREFVTVHTGTELGGGVTLIGNHNRFLVGVHLAHDTQVGSNVVISNNVQIAGHVHIEDCVTLGGQTAIHHFVTVGKYAMVGGLSRLATDAPPYLITSGYPARVRSVNFHALKRWSLPQSDIDAIAGAYRALYSKRGGMETPFAQRVEQLERTNGHNENEHVLYLCQFLKRTLSVGNSGRYLESLRRDTPEDVDEFFKGQTLCDTPAAGVTLPDTSKGDT